VRGKQIKDAIATFLGVAGANRLIRTASNGKIHPSLIDAGVYPSFDQQSVPSNPAIGNIWIERNGDSSIKYTWQWNGALWLSSTSQPLELYSNSGNISGTNVGSAKIPGMPFECDLFIENFALSLYLNQSISPGGANDSALNYYVFRVEKVIRNAGVQIGTSLSMQNSTVVSGWNFFKPLHPINTLVSLANAHQDSTNAIARGVRLAWTRSAGTAQFGNSCATVSYRLARR
jgi:hypothetical protein